MLVLQKMSRIYDVDKGPLDRQPSLNKPGENINRIASKLQERDKSKFQTDGTVSSEPTSDHADLIPSDFSTAGQVMLQYQQHRMFEDRRHSGGEFIHARPPSPGMHPGISQSPEHQSDYEETSSKRQRYEDEASELESLERFAKDFKQRRIKMGFTQGDVGVAMGRFYGNDFSQTTISRFEALNLRSPVLSQPMMAMNSQSCAGRKRKKRTSIPTEGKSRLEDAFLKNPKPTTEEIGKFSEDLNMDREVVRVWFCNRRQKQKRIATQQQRYVGEQHSPSSPAGFNEPHSVEGQRSPISSEDENYGSHHLSDRPPVHQAIEHSEMGTLPPQLPPRPGIIQLKLSESHQMQFGRPPNYSSHSSLMGGNSAI